MLLLEGEGITLDRQEQQPHFFSSLLSLLEFCRLFSLVAEFILLISPPTSATTAPAAGSGESSDDGIHFVSASRWVRRRRCISRRNDDAVASATTLQPISCHLRVLVRVDYVQRFATQRQARKVATLARAHRCNPHAHAHTRALTPCRMFIARQTPGGQIIWGRGRNRAVFLLFAG